jgi:GH35 family endo-1,4-beta-xylanase
MISEPGVRRRIDVVVCVLVAAHAALGCATDEPATAHRAAAVLGDADDPFEAPARVLADELGFTFGVQHAPWMGPSWSSWNAAVAAHFNSFTNLGALTQITLKNGADAPLYLTELGWAMTDATDPTYYPPAQPFSTMRGHTTVWYASAVLPPWLAAADAGPGCPGPACALDQPSWCSSGGTVDCSLPGMYAPNPAASLREHTLRREVWNVVQALRATMGPRAPLQVDVANEMVLTVFPWQSYGVFTRLPGESDPAYFARIAMPASRLWSDIRPSDRLYFLELAYKIARAADARAKLFLNDYDPEVEGFGHKSAVTREVARMLRARGAPVNGVGMQFHLKDTTVTSGPFDHIGLWSSTKQAAVQSYMTHLADVGVEAAVTEFDFLVLEGTDPAVALRHEARAAREILDACIDSGNCATFIAWGAIEDATSYPPGAVHPRGVIAHDLRLLAPYRALERGFARGVVPGSVAIEAEQLPTTAGATASGGQPFVLDGVDGYMLWTNGSLTAPVSVPVTGTYDYDVFGTGFPAAGQDPRVELWLDATRYVTFPMSTATTHYKPEFVLTAGNYTAKLSFINDFQGGGEDRNVFIDAIVLRPRHRVGRHACHAMQVVELGVKDSTAQEFGWALAFGNAGFRDAVSVTRTGWYKISLLAYGFGATSDETVEARVDGVPQTTWSLVNAPYGSAGTSYEVQVYLTRGTHEVGVWFTNDAYAPPSDRNVALKQLEICPVLETRGSVAFSASATASAQRGYTQVPIYLEANQILTAGVCGAGASFTGDPYLVLTNAAGEAQAISDDSCGLGSQIVITAPTAGTYWLRLGCFSDGACAGNAVWTIDS